MSALHVVVRPRPRGGSPASLAALTGLIDVVVEGVNLTARVGEGPALDFLVDLSLGFASVLSAARPRVTVTLPTSTELWELGLEAAGDRVLLSVFRQTPQVAIAVFERSLDVTELRTALATALEDALAEGAETPGSVALGLKAAQRALRTTATQTVSSVERVEANLARDRGGLRLQLRARLRHSVPRIKTPPRLERSDLHGALVLGSLELAFGPNRVRLPEAQVFLDLERLLALAEEAMASLANGRPTFRRAQLTSARASLRRGPGDGPVELRIEPLNGKAFFAVFPAETLAHVFAEMALALTQSICQHDPEQECNLRVSRLASLATDLLAQLVPADPDESVPNPQPDSYRRFVPRVKRTQGVWEHGAKMRFQPRWVATMPRIDLRGTFLCGDRLVVGGTSETACLERRTGEILWRHAFGPAASVVTPSGLVRIEPDGRLSCHHLDDGAVRFTLRMKPRVHGGATGSVLYGPGLPKLLAVSEGDRQVTGIDLVNGDVRWRYSAKRPAPYRVRRAGRLLFVAGGDPLMVALDGMSGDVVWTLKSRLPFSGDVAVDHDTACTLSGTPGGRWFLHLMNPWSGEEAWLTELDERPLGRTPLLTPNTVVVPTSDGEGTGAVAYHRRTGQKAWEQAPGLVQGTSAWLVVDDCVLVNSARGVFLGLDATTGAVRFSHVFSSSCEADQPRRLEPILRSGALFVPQERVHVARPLSGELLGALPSDLVPDLIRVDERCDVYVAEESGHLAAFGVAPKLAIVR